jgi:hypothetical protein
MTRSLDHSTDTSTFRRLRRTHRSRSRAALHGLAAGLAFVLIAGPSGALAAPGSGMFTPDVTTPLPYDLRPLVEPEREEKSGASARVPVPARVVPLAFGSLLLLYGLGRARRAAPAPGGHRALTDAA